MLKQSLQRHAAMIKFYDYWKFETLLMVTTETTVKMGFFNWCHMYKHFYRKLR